MTTEQKIAAVEHALDGHAELIAEAHEVAEDYVIEQESPFGPELMYLGQLALKLSVLAEALGKDFVDDIVEEERVRAALSTGWDEDVSYRAEYSQKFYGVNP